MTAPDRYTIIQRIGSRIPGKVGPAYSAAEQIYDEVIAPLLADSGSWGQRFDALMAESARAIHVSIPVEDNDA